MAQSPAVYRRRRLVAGATLVVLLGLLVFALTRSSEPPPRESSARVVETPTPTPTPRPQLPRGGRAILPDYRVVAYYGAPQDRQLGALGIGTPAQAARKLERQARGYARKSRPVLPAFELIAVVAAAHPGEGDRYNIRQEDKVIARYLRAARRAKALLILDIQPGRSDFFTEARRLEKWLREPDVGLALDPEWRMQPGQVPGQVIGQVSAREVNATTAWLDRLTREHDLPQKLLIVHQFTDDMVPESALKPRDGLAYVLNADGFGSREVKVEKYKRFVAQAPAFARGFKLFYEEDAGTMTPAQVMRLQPRPDVIVYE